MSDSISEVEQSSTLTEDHTSLLDSAHYNNRLQYPPSHTSLAPSDSVSQSASRLVIESVPAMSDKAERIFSQLGNIARPNRAALKGSTLAATACLKNWDYEAVIDFLPGLALNG